MLGEGHTFKEIEEATRKDGYNGAASTIRMCSKGAIPGGLGPGH